MPSNRDQIHARLDRYNELARSCSFYAGLTFATALFLAVTAAYEPTHVWLLGLTAVAFLIAHLVTIGLSRHFAGKSQRIRKRLDSYGT